MAFEAFSEGRFSASHQEKQISSIVAEGKAFLCKVLVFHSFCFCRWVSLAGESWLPGGGTRESINNCIHGDPGVSNMKFHFRYPNIYVSLKKDNNKKERII